MEEKPLRKRRRYKEYNDADSHSDVPRQTVWSADNPSGTVPEPSTQSLSPVNTQRGERSPSPCSSCSQSDPLLSLSPLHDSHHSLRCSEQIAVNQAMSVSDPAACLDTNDGGVESYKLIHHVQSVHHRHSALSQISVRASHESGPGLSSSVRRDYDGDFNADNSGSDRIINSSLLDNPMGDRAVNSSVYRSAQGSSKDLNSPVKRCSDEDSNEGDSRSDETNISSSSDSPSQERAAFNVSGHGVAQGSGQDLNSPVNRDFHENSNEGDSGSDKIVNSSPLDSPSEGSVACNISDYAAGQGSGLDVYSSINRDLDVSSNVGDNGNNQIMNLERHENPIGGGAANEISGYRVAEGGDSDPSSSDENSDSDDDRPHGFDRDLNIFSEDSSSENGDEEIPENPEEHNHQHGDDPPPPPPPPPSPPPASGLDKLREKLRGEYSTRVEDRAAASRGEILLNIQEFCKQHPLPLTAQEDLYKLVNTIFYKDIVPGTKYKLDKLYSSKSNIKYYFFCSKCFVCFGELDHQVVRVKECDECGTQNIVHDLTKANFFIMIDIVEQLQLLLQDPEIATELKNPNEFEDNGETMKDLHDGSVYKDFVASLEFIDGQWYMSFTACTDGTPVFACKNSLSIWPIFLSVNELPAYIRMKNILLAGLWFSKSHPKMDLFLEKFSDYMRKLSIDGFLLTVAGLLRYYKGFLLGVCVDAGARGAVQCIHAHNGESSCNWCLHPGEVEGNGSTARKFLPYDLEPALRTKEQMLRDGQAVLGMPGKDNHINGVLGISPLLRCPKFHIVDGFVLDSLHWANFGVARRMGKLWMGETKKKKKKKQDEENAANNTPLPQYYVGTNETSAVIDKRVSHLRPPLEVRRLPREMSLLHDFNAREWENWTLYFSIPLFINILPERYLRHWVLFVQGYYLLMLSERKKSETDVSHELMKCYVNGVFQLYGKKENTYNVHISLHAAANAQRWGNAYCVSTYAFENGNKILKSKINAQRGIPHQIIRSLSRDLALNVLRAEASTAQTDEYRSTIARKVKKCFFAGPVQCFRPRKFIPSEEERWYCERENVNVDSFVECSRIITGNICYSVDKGSTKTNNSFACSVGGEIFKIRKIIAEEDSREVYLFVSKVRCTPYGLPPLPRNITLSNFSPFLYTVDIIEQGITVISYQALKTICIYTPVNCQFYKGNFLSIMANTCNVF
ncbi:hypothetical protein ONE63_008161 [Megalurothrips usitatus]|uniref:Uncharacterized protein n=1 Tax=Megalurothrips usitatus TaxID=439358 RepID=A0AAV7XKA1_9NEOP|nr:hypothetical protein ONE63_008161 [Megalurothrips usitatus]